jgi:hypothetical protein
MTIFDDLDDLLDGTSQIVSARFTSAAMPADALDPDTGNIQTRTLSANTVFTDALAAGRLADIAPHEGQLHRDMACCGLGSRRC